MSIGETIIISVLILGALAYVGRGLWQTVLSAYAAPGEAGLSCGGGSCGCESPAATSSDEAGGCQQSGCPVVESGLDSLRESLSEVKSHQETTSQVASTIH